jgi:hypothetical protein
VQVTLIGADVQRLKISTFPGVFLAARSSLTLDFSGNALRDPSTLTALVATSITPDTSAPHLTSFSLNITSGVLRMTFDEPVNITTLSPAFFTLQSGSDITGVSLTFSDSTPTPTGTSPFTVLSLALVPADLQRLNLELNFAATILDTYISSVSNACLDYASNPAAVIPASSALRASSVVRSVSAPHTCASSCSGS